MVISVLYFVLRLPAHGHDGADRAGLGVGTTPSCGRAGARPAARGGARAGPDRCAGSGVLAGVVIAPEPPESATGSRPISRSACSAPRRRLASYASCSAGCSASRTRARPLVLMLAHQRHQRRALRPPVRVRLRPGGWRASPRRRCWPNMPAWARPLAGPPPLARPGRRLALARASLVAARFRRCSSVNRDLFLRSLLLEAVFLAFTALGSRQGEVVARRQRRAADLLHRRRLRAGRLRPRRRGAWSARRRRAATCARPCGRARPPTRWRWSCADPGARVRPSRPAWVALMTGLARGARHGAQPTCPTRRAAAGRRLGLPLRRRVLRRHAHGRAAQRHGLAAARASCRGLELLVPRLGNHGLWLALCCSWRPAGSGSACWGGASRARASSRTPRAAP